MIRFFSVIGILVFGALSLKAKNLECVEGLPQLAETVAPRFTTDHESTSLWDDAPDLIQMKFSYHNSRDAWRALMRGHQNSVPITLYAVGRLHWGVWNMHYQDLQKEPADIGYLKKRAQELKLDVTELRLSLLQNLPFFTLRVKGAAENILEFAKEPGIQKFLDWEPSFKDRPFLFLHRLPLIDLLHRWDQHSIYSPSNLQAGMKFHIVAVDPLGQDPKNSRISRVEAALKRHFQNLSENNAGSVLSQSGGYHEQGRFKGAFDEARWFILDLKNDSEASARLRALKADPDFANLVWIDIHEPQFLTPSAL